MSKYWMTPEAMIKRKERRKKLIVAGAIIGAMVLSALITIMANQI
jgi:hypothetical protein